MFAYQTAMGFLNDIRKLILDAKARGISENQMAAAAGVTTSTINRFLNGKQSPGIVGFAPLLDYLNATVCAAGQCKRETGDVDVSDVAQAINDLRVSGFSNSEIAAVAHARLDAALKRTLEPPPEAQSSRRSAV